jgi:hypothetical protein
LGLQAACPGDEIANIMKAMTSAGRQKTRILTNSTVQALGRSIRTKPAREFLKRFSYKITFTFY